MKKMMMMALMALVAVAAQAKDDKVTLTSGDGQWLKESDKTTSVVIDYSNTIAEGQPLKEYLKSRGDKNVNNDFFSFISGHFCDCSAYIVSFPAFFFEPENIK